MLYTLKLRNNYWFIGYTEQDVDVVIAEHFRGAGNEWTRMHKPVEIVVKLEGTRTDLDQLVLDCMTIHGWWRVRGGKYGHANMNKAPTQLKHQETPRRHICQRCGRKGHFTHMCVASINIYGCAIIDNASCFRCGYSNHITDECTAIFNIFGYALY